MKCTFCGHTNREGIYFCEACGRLLRGETRRIDDPGKTNDLPEETFGQALTHKPIILLIGEEKLKLDLQSSLIIGRSDPTLVEKPGIDLLPYGGEEKGVSRRHAKIERDGSTLKLTDLNSTNGTRVNDRKLPPNQPHLLRDGDTIRVGNLGIEIRFTSSNRQEQEKDNLATG